MDRKEILKYKHECHKLLETIWGWDKVGKMEAYKYLKKEFGKEIHFSEINDLELLKRIKDKLLVHSILSENEKFLDEVHNEFRKEDTKYKINLKKKFRKEVRNEKFFRYKY